MPESSAAFRLARGFIPGLVPRWENGGFHQEFDGGCA